MKVQLRLTAVAATAILLAGCGGGASNTAANAGTAAPANGTVVAQGGGATVTKDGAGTTTVTTNQGSAQITMGAPSGDLPGGLPAYPNAQAGGGINVQGQGAGGSGRVVSFTTTDTPQQVIDFYANAAGQAGLTTTSRSAMGPNATLALTKGNEGIAVTATQLGGSTQVQIAAGSR